MCFLFLEMPVFDLKRNLYDWTIACRKDIEETAKAINCEARQHFSIDMTLLLEQYIQIIGHFQNEVNACEVLQCASKQITSSCLPLLKST